MIRPLPLCLAMLALSACRAAAPLPPLSGTAPSDRPVAFQVPFYGKPGVWDPAMDRGHVILVDVWATWCEPCRDALPIWQDVAKEYGGRGLKVYALSVDEDPAQVAKFIEETKLTLPVLMDQNGKIAESTLKVKMMPTSFLIDRKGLVRYVNEGFAEDHLAKYQKQIELLLGERK